MVEYLKSWLLGAAVIAALIGTIALFVVVFGINAGPALLMLIGFFFASYFLGAAIRGR